jgi:hypothetical protein
MVWGLSSLRMTPQSFFPP